MTTPAPALIARQLADTELFAGLRPEALVEVAAGGRVQQLGKGAVLFTQGGPADRCHALLEGRIRIAQSGTGGGQLIVRFVGPGQTFGTVALFTNRRYPAEAVVLTDSVVISWPHQDILELIRRHPQIALNLVGIVGARLREVQERLREVATERVDRRIANALLRLADPGRAGGEGAVIEFPLTRRDVAEMCGATLHTVSRVLTAWEKAGYIATHRRRLTIHRPETLRRLAGENLEH